MVLSLGYCGLIVFVSRQLSKLIPAASASVWAIKGHYGAIWSLTLRRLPKPAAKLLPFHKHFQGRFLNKKTKNKKAHTLHVSSSELYTSPLNENTFKRYQLTLHEVMMRKLIAFHRALQHKTRVVCIASIYFTMTKMVKLNETLTQYK